MCANRSLEITGAVVWRLLSVVKTDELTGCQLVVDLSEKVGKMQNTEDVVVVVYYL
jgi:hypothetical protein